MIETKLCSGPSHPKPVLLPLDRTHWYFRGPSAWATQVGLVGKPLSWCRVCWLWRKVGKPEAAHGLVSSRKVEPLLYELVARHGSIAGAARAADVSRQRLDAILSRTAPTVKAETARKILRALKDSDGQAAVMDYRTRAALRRRARGAYCVGCGGEIVPGRYTDGCPRCLDRRIKRELRRGADQ